MFSTIACTASIRSTTQARGTSETGSPSTTARQVGAVIAVEPDPDGGGGGVVQIGREADLLPPGRLLARKAGRLQPFQGSLQACRLQLFLLIIIGALSALFLGGKGVNGALQRKNRAAGGPAKSAGSTSVWRSESQDAAISAL